MSRIYYWYNEILEFVGQIERKEIRETKEVLMKQTDEHFSVAHWLAHFHSTWTTNDLEILILYSPTWKRTVEDMLEEKGKI